MMCEIEKLSNELDDALSRLSLTDKWVEKMFELIEKGSPKELVMKHTIIALAEMLESEKRESSIKERLNKRYRLLIEKLEKIIVLQEKMLTLREKQVMLKELGSNIKI